MKNNYTPEKILILVSLILFSGIIFYNTFFIPEVTIPTVVYVDKDYSDNENLPDSNSNQTLESNSNQNFNNVNSSITNGEKVNINTATESELAEKIPGVGESIAKKIVEYRNYNGNFSSIEEIKNVSGIGDKKFEAMKDIICV